MDFALLKYCANLHEPAGSSCSSHLNQCMQLRACVFSHL